VGQREQHLCKDCQKKKASQQETSGTTEQTKTHAELATSSSSSSSSPSSSSFASGSSNLSSSRPKQAKSVYREAAKVTAKILGFAMLLSLAILLADLSDGALDGKIFGSQRFGFGRHLARLINEHILPHLDTGF